MPNFARQWSSSARAAGARAQMFTRAWMATSPIVMSDRLDPIPTYKVKRGRSFCSEAWLADESSSRPALSGTDRSDDLRRKPALIHEIPMDGSMALVLEGRRERHAAAAPE